MSSVIEYSGCHEAHKIDLIKADMEAGMVGVDRDAEFEEGLVERMRKV